MHQTTMRHWDSLLKYLFTKYKVQFQENVKKVFSETKAKVILNMIKFNNELLKTKKETEYWRLTINMPYYHRP